MNKVILVGRTCKDIDLKNTSNGIPYCYFTLAVDRDYKDSSNERVVDFIDIIAWRNNATFLKNYVSKGRLILVEGNVQVRKVQNQDNYSTNVIQIVCDRVEFLGADTTNKTEEQPKKYSYNKLEDNSNKTLSFASSGDLLDEDSDLPF